MKIDVYYKNVYGNDLCYPACEDAKIFAEMAGQKTLIPYTLKHTNLKFKKINNKVNIETDMMSKYVEKILSK